MTMIHLNKRVRVISLHQPWASAIAVGIKMVETRSWGTNYRGLLAIHATKKQDQICRLQAKLALKNGSDSWAVFQLFGIKTEKDLPRGAIVAVATLEDCIRITPAILNRFSQNEHQWGDFSMGRFVTRDCHANAEEKAAIKLAMAVPLEEKISKALLLLRGYAEMAGPEGYYPPWLRWVSNGKPKAGLPTMARI